MALKTVALVGMVMLAFAAHAARAENSTEDPDLPKCNALSYNQSLAFHPDAFGSLDIELAFDDYRGWVKKKIKSYVSLAKRGYARKRKRTPATIIVRTRQGVSCKLRAKIRAHGDADDHYPGDLNEEPSLNISLTDGHLFGITKFILFRPDTRNGENEIFAATLIGQLGFLSPRTAMSTLRLTGSDRPPVNVIFQEKIVKEFLELNRVREGPIIEGDERFSFDPRYEHLKRGAALARVSNFKWALKGPTSMAIAARALEQVNRLYYWYDKSWATNKGSNLVDMSELLLLLDGEHSPLKFEDYPVFEAIAYSMGATHGLAQDDRRTVYDPLSNSFWPIYYDGGATILTAPDRKLERKITRSAQKSVPQALKRLVGLDLAALQKSLKARRVNLSHKQLQTITNKMKARLARMAISNEVEPVKVKQRTLYGRPGNRISYVFTTNKPDRFEVCSDSLVDCHVIEATPKVSAKLLAQSWRDQKNRPGIHFAFPKSEIGQPFAGFADKSLPRIEIQSFVLDGFRLDAYGDITVKIDKINSSIAMTRTGASGRAVISNGELGNWSVTLDDVSGHVKNEKAGEQNFDRLGLTGCLTITDIHLSSPDIVVNNATCEDGVNFIRVTGEARKVIVRNAAFDAIDADFSNLSFTDIIVEKAGNDCLDLSYGVYHGKNLILKQCGDKAVSVGETSRATIDNILAQDVLIGLAAKDFGTIELGNGKVEDSQKCFDLYNKKKEFSGGQLKIGSGVLNCSGAKGEVGPTSLLSGAIHY